MGNKATHFNLPKIFLQLIFRGKNPGVEYEFWIPVEKLAEFQKVQDRRREAQLAELAVKNTGFYIPHKKDSPYSPKEEETKQYSVIQNDPGTKLFDLPPDGSLNSIKVNSDLYWREENSTTGSKTKGSALTALIAARAKTQVLPTRRPYNANKNNIINKYGERWEKFAESKGREKEKKNIPTKISNKKKRKKKRDKHKKKQKLPGK